MNSFSWLVSNVDFLATTIRLHSNSWWVYERFRLQWFPSPMISNKALEITWISIEFMNLRDICLTYCSKSDRIFASAATFCCLCCSYFTGSIFCYSSPAWADSLLAEAYVCGYALFGAWIYLAVVSTSGPGGAAGFCIIGCWADAPIWLACYFLLALGIWFLCCSTRCWRASNTCSCTAPMAASVTVFHPSRIGNLSSEIYSLTSIRSKKFSSKLKDLWYFFSSESVTHFAWNVCYLSYSLMIFWLRSVLSSGILLILLTDSFHFFLTSSKTPLLFSMLSICLSVLITLNCSL